MKLHCIFQSKNKKQSWEKRRGEGTILDSDTDSHKGAGASYLEDLGEGRMVHEGEAPSEGK
jgi:hypothetical protein